MAPLSHRSPEWLGASVDTVQIDDDTVADLRMTTGAAGYIGGDVPIAITEAASVTVTGSQATANLARPPAARRRG